MPGIKDCNQNIQSRFHGMFLSKRDKDKEKGKHTLSKER